MRFPRFTPLLAAAAMIVVSAIGVAVDLVAGVAAGILARLIPVVRLGDSARRQRSAERDRGGEGLDKSLHGGRPSILDKQSQRRKGSGDGRDFAAHVDILAESEPVTALCRSFKSCGMRASRRMAPGLSASEQY